MGVVRSSENISSIWAAYLLYRMFTWCYCSRPLRARTSRFKNRTGTLTCPSTIPSSLLSSLMIFSIIVKTSLNTLIYWLVPMTVRSFSFLKKSLLSESTYSKLVLFPIWYMSAAFFLTTFYSSILTLMHSFIISVLRFSLRLSLDSPSTFSCSS